MLRAGVATPRRMMLKTSPSFLSNSAGVRPFKSFSTVVRQDLHLVVRKNHGEKLSAFTRAPARLKTRAAAALR